MYYSAENELMLGNVHVARADRLPCPVCGHQTGDCTGAGHAPIHVLGPDAYISMDYEETFIVKEDVYENRWISPYTECRVKVAVAGTAIPLSKAEALGLTSI